MQPECGYLDDIDGARIYYEVMGEGSPVVLLHTGNGNTSIWDGQFEELAQRFRVVRYDLRGFGRSSYPPRPFLWASDLREVLLRLGIDRAHVIGPSLGGRIAIEFTVLYPEMVQSLVLAAPVVRRFDWSDMVVQTRHREDEAMLAGEFDKATDLMMQSWVSGPCRTIDQIDPAMVARIRVTQRMAYEVQRAAARSAETPGTEEELDTPAEDRLGEITVPVLMIVGDQDQPDALAIGDLLMAGIPNIGKVVFEGVGHMITMERPREFLDRAVEHITAQVPVRNAS
jgi:pimeloyl-ACP methyl ester carboxylesterase